MQMFTKRFNKGFLRTLGLMFVFTMMLSLTPVYASAKEAPLLDDINKDNKNTESTTKGNTDTEDSEFINGIQQGMDMTGAQDEFTKQAGGAIQKIATIIVQVLSYVITGALSIRVVCDLLYIVAPPLRVLLANGYVGNPSVAGGQQNMQGGAMGGMQGGMGMGGMGMGGYGNNRYGGGMGGMGMGGMGGMQGGMGGMQGNQMAMQNQPSQGRIQWVSNAALNAVATESTIGPDGKSNGAFKTYSKDMIVMLIVTPILVILATTGVLADLGFIIGMGIENVIRAWTTKF